MAKIFILNVAEFEPLLAFARTQPHWKVTPFGTDYNMVEAEELVFDRKAMGLKPAIWYGAFTGGLDGQITEFGRDTVRIAGAVQ